MPKITFIQPNGVRADVDVLLNIVQGVRERGTSILYVSHRLDEVFRKFAPGVTYHAAAYKHVPLMEVHEFEAVENNIFGTYNVIAAAGEHGVEGNFARQAGTTIVEFRHQRLGAIVSL